MYCIVLLCLITVAICQPSVTLVPVKKGYFDITPSATQLTITLQNGVQSKSIELNDSGHIFGDLSSEEKGMPSQQILELFSTGAFQLQPFHEMISEITSNACLMSLSSNEEHVTDAVDFDSVVEKVGALAGLIVADMATVSGRNPQTILQLYNAAKSGTPFNTAQLTLSGSNSNSRVTIQVDLGGYPFELGIPLRTQSRTKETQCINISKIATIRTLNLITSSAIQALQPSDAVNGPELNSDKSSYLSTASKVSIFAKELADKTTDLGSSDVVSEALSNSEKAESMMSQTSQSISANGSNVFNSNAQMVPSNPNTSVKYGTTQPITKGTNIKYIQSPNIEENVTGSPITEKSTFIATGTSTNTDKDTETGANAIDTINGSGTTRTADAKSNFNTNTYSGVSSNSITNTNSNSNADTFSLGHPIMSSIPRLQEHPDSQSQNIGKFNYNSRIF